MAHFSCPRGNQRWTLLWFGQFIFDKFIFSSYSYVLLWLFISCLFNNLFWDCSKTPAGFCSIGYFLAQGVWEDHPSSLHCSHPTGSSSACADSISSVPPKPSLDGFFLLHPLIWLTGNYSQSADDKEPFLWTQHCPFPSHPLVPLLPLSSPDVFTDPPVGFPLVLSENHSGLPVWFHNGAGFDADTQRAPTAPTSLCPGFAAGPLVLGSVLVFSALLLAG